MCALGFSLEVINPVLEPVRLLFALSLVELGQSLLSIKLISAYVNEIHLLSTLHLDLKESIALLLYPALTRHLLVARCPTHLDLKPRLRDVAL